ncbi:flagellar brake protein [Kaarinaea lacus]
MAFSLKQFIPFLNPETEQVSDVNFRHSQKICEIFQLLKETRTVLTVKLPDSKKQFSSSIIKVDLEKKQFTLDEIYPVDGHKLFENTGKLIALAELHGARISFETCRITSDNSRQISSYQCHIPESVSYIQRREEYRVSVHSTQIIQITAEHRETNQLVQGRVCDISPQGIGIVFNTAHTIKPGDQLNRCQLMLPRNDSVNFSLDVRHIESTTPGTIRVGGSFLDLTTRSREIISRFVRHLERASIKNQS